MDLSPTIGDIWGSIMLPCNKYTVRAMHRYTGPWQGDTSHPVLFIGNTADPVTPLQNAKDMVGGFKGARVLTQDSPGHCSLAAYSKCTVSHISQYFLNGTLPEVGTLCKADVVPWGDVASAGVYAPRLQSAAEQYTLLAEALLANGGGMGHQHAAGKVDHGRLMAAQMQRK